MKTGRKRLDDVSERTRKFSATLTPTYHAIIKKYGDGNFSNGIRKMLKELMLLRDK